MNHQSIKQVYESCKEVLSPVWGNEEARAITDYLFQEKFDLGRTAIISKGDQPFEHEDELFALLSRLQQSEPVQQVLGYAYFCRLKISITKDVLIPRPETEELIELAKTHITSSQTIIADICTGSGCMALALKHLFPTNHIIATDISLPALAVAQANATTLFKTGAIHFEHHDILSGTWSFPIPHIIVCNPPYIGLNEATNMNSNVLRYEPHLALFVEDEDPLLFYKAVIRLFLPHPFPLIFFEINPFYAEALVAFCNEHQLTCILTNDIHNNTRFALIEKGDLQQ